MEKDCILIKKKDYDELIKPKTDKIKEYEDTLNDLRKNHSEYVSKLLREIRELKVNPKIDPMRLSLSMERVVIRKEGSSYYYPQGRTISEQIHPYELITSANISLDQPIRKQILNIVKLISIRAIEQKKIDEEKLKHENTEKTIREVIREIMLKPNWIKRIQHIKKLYKSHEPNSRSKQ